MNNFILKISLIFLYLVLMMGKTHSATAKIEANEGVVKIVSGGRTGTYLRLTDEMKGVLPGNSQKKLRILPVIGLGSQQNLNDLLYLKGIDIALMQSDVMAAAKIKHKNLNSKIRFITKLHDEEVHILARKEISTIFDLAGKNVSIGNLSSGTAMTAKLIFDTLNIKPNFLNYSSTEALKKLSKNDDGIDAFVYVSGKPVDIFLNINRSNNFHFLDVPAKPLAHIYKKTSLTSRDYKNLVDGDVNTVAVQAVLAVFNFKKKSSQRYINVRLFVEALFKSKEELSRPQNKFHKKWQTIDLCEKVPGWERHASVGDIFKTYCTNVGSIANKEALPQNLIKVYLSLSPKKQEWIMSLSLSDRSKSLALLEKTGQ